MSDPRTKSSRVVHEEKEGINMESVTVYEVQIDKTSTKLVLDSLSELADYLDGDEPQAFLLCEKTMTKAARDALPEFDGW